MDSKIMIRFTQIALCLVASSQIACHTVSPDEVVPSSESMGPNGEHSGVYAVEYSQTGAITAQLWYEANRTEYNALAVKFGGQFIPKVTPDFHLTKDGTYWKADDTAITDYIQLLELKRKAQIP